MTEVNQMVPTRGSQLRQNSSFEVVVYHNPSKGSKTNASRMITQDKKTPEFDMKKAKNEVIKLGMEGFFKFKKEKTMAELVMKLGAKPEKKKEKNYKDLKKLRIEQKQRREMKLNMLKESSDLSAVNHYKKKYAQRKARRQQKNFSILNDYGKMKRK